MKVFKKAILVVHGFAGGVYDQEYLTHRLELIDNKIVIEKAKSK